MTNEVQAQPKETPAQTAARQEAEARRHNETVERTWMGRGCVPPGYQSALR